MLLKKRLSFHDTLVYAKRSQLCTYTSSWLVIKLDSSIVAYGSDPQCPHVERYNRITLYNSCHVVLHYPFCPASDLAFLASTGGARAHPMTPDLPLLLPPSTVCGTPSTATRPWPAQLDLLARHSALHSSPLPISNPAEPASRLHRPPLLQHQPQTPRHAPHLLFPYLALCPLLAEAIEESLGLVDLDPG